MLVPEVQAVAGRGLAGDRYEAGAGTFTPVRGGGRGYDLTLIEAEVLDQFVLPDGRRLRYGARGSLVTGPSISTASSVDDSEWETSSVWTASV